MTNTLAYYTGVLLNTVKCFVVLLHGIWVIYACVSPTFKLFDIAETNFTKLFLVQFKHFNRKLECLLHTVTLVQAQYLRVLVESLKAGKMKWTFGLCKIVYQTRYLCPSIVFASKAGAYLKRTLSKLTTKSPKFKTWTRIFAWSRNKLIYYLNDRLKYLSQLKANVFFSKKEQLITSGLYYKHIMIVIDAPSVVSKWCSKLERHLLTIVIDDAS